MANKAIKYRVYPTTEQSIMFAKTFGCCRKVYNLMLSDKIEEYELTGKFPTVTPAKYKDEYPYLREVDSLALANKQMDLQKDAFNFNKMLTQREIDRQNRADDDLYQAFRNSSYYRGV